MQRLRSLPLLFVLVLALLICQARASAAQSGSNEPGSGGSAHLARPIDGHITQVSQTWGIPMFADFRSDIWVLLHRLDSQAWMGQGRLAAGKPCIVARRKSKLH